MAAKVSHTHCPKSYPSLPKYTASALSHLSENSGCEDKMGVSNIYLLAVLDITLPLHNPPLGRLHVQFGGMATGRMRCKTDEMID